MKSVSYALLLVLTLSPTAFSEGNDPGAESVESAKGILEDYAKAPKGQITGALEIRPSVQHRTNRVGAEDSSRGYTQDTLEFGYTFSPAFSLDYTQYFMTNFLDPAGKDSGLGLVGGDGFVRARFSNIWQNVAKDLSLGFESRVYLPTNPGSRAAGFVTAMRNYASLKWTQSSRFNILVQEIPIVYGFTQAGVTGAANPIFENRIYIIPTYNFTDKLAFSFPILLNMTRNRAFNSSAANNDRWTFVLWTWPEITYTIAPKTTVGVAFMSENLMTDNLSAFNLFGNNGGITTGSTQVILRQDI